MPVFVFSLVTTLIVLASGVLIVLIISQAVGRARRARYEMFHQMIEKGIYDPRILGVSRGKSRRGHATLAWGIILAAIGLAIFIALAVSPAPQALRIGLAGALVPLFVGIAFLVFYAIMRKAEQPPEENGAPIVLGREGSAPRAAEGQPALRVDVRKEGD
jgi:hypothetical protein